LLGQGDWVGAMVKQGGIQLAKSVVTLKKQPASHRYFTELTAQKAIFYFLAVSYLLAASVVVTFEPMIPVPCASHEPSAQQLEFENVMYVEDPCRHTRFGQLLYLTAEECMFGRRLVWSVVLGGIVGWERRMADRPAGIRTMSLVSLGSCLFTINSSFAFLSGPMSWDSSRVSAAIPSGVGFLGAGMIFKEANKDEGTGRATHVVHGLTTAASLWLSAAVGIACGGGLYFAASFCVAIMLVLLRFGPRQIDDEEDDDDDDNDEDHDDHDEDEDHDGGDWDGDHMDGLDFMAHHGGGGIPSLRSVGSDMTGSVKESGRMTRESSRASLTKRSTPRNKRAQLASIV